MSSAQPNDFVFPASDRAALAEVLRRVLAEPERCRAMGRASLEIIEHWGFREDIAGLKQALGMLPQFSLDHAAGAPHRAQPVSSCRS